MKTTSLAAVVYTQIADFELILQADNTLALRLLEDYKTMIRALLTEHDGEAVDLTGDEFLAIFGSAVHAVQFALHARLSAEVLRRQYAGLAVTFQLCTGIHLGEIWRDEQRVYGNGINIGARVKQAAGPGMILVSEDVERQVANKLDLVFTECQAGQLKNIERPLRLFLLDDGSGSGTSVPVATASTSGLVPTSTERMASDPPVVPGLAESWLSTPSISDGAVVGNPAVVEAEEPEEPEEPEEREEPGTSISFTYNSDKAQKAGRTTELSPEARLESFQRKQPQLVGKLVSFAVSTAVFGWLYYRYESAWWFMGAAVFGFLPFLSNLKALVRNQSEIRVLRRKLKD